MGNSGDQIDWTRNQPAPSRLIRVLTLNFSQVRNLGIYAARTVAGTNQPSSHAEGRALDVGLRADRPGEKMLADQLFRIIIDNAFSAGIDNVIWNRQIWSSSHGGPRPFVGTYSNGALKNPHTDHIHIEWTRRGSQLRVLQFLEFQINRLRGDLEDLNKAYKNFA
jgi:hypothetical protein